MRERSAVAALLLVGSLWGLSAGAQQPAGADDHFHARFSDDLRTVAAELCFAGRAPDRIYRHSSAAPYASTLSHAGKALAVTVTDDRELALPPLPDNACLQWTVDLGRAADEGGYRSAFRVGDSVLSLTNMWFWKGPWQRPLVARIDVPEGHRFSTPWARDAADPARFRPERTPSTWYTRSAVGPFYQETIGMPGSRVELALLGDLDPAQIDKLRRWLRITMDSVVPVFGYFPKDHTQVLVVPIGARNEAVPWAHVIRGGGPAIHFYVDETRPFDEFNDDWTATHEFSHLLLPFVARKDRWLSEGLASYYQNVLRARDGRLGQREAWQKLFEGFGRGQRGTNGETLREATLGGWENVMRIYWSGAAMMLEADAALRAESEGRQSLDTVLQMLNRCCLTEGKRWRARELMEELDTLSGSDVFTRVYRRHVDSGTFPDVERQFETLGLSIRDGQVQLLEDAPLKAIRDQIMAVAPAERFAAPGRDSAP